MKQEFRTSEMTPTVVTDPDAARLVLDTTSGRMLAPFMGRSLSVADAAREANVPLNTLKYRVAQFERLGLLARDARDTRRGRSVQTYRAPASLFVPFRVTPLEGAAYLYDVLFDVMHEPLLRSVGAAWQAAAGEDRELGVHVYRNASDRVTKDIVPQPEPGEHQSFFVDLLGDDRPAVWNSGATVRFTREEAKAFQRDLVALLRRHIRPPATDEERFEYIYRFVLAPYVRPGEEGSS